MSAESRACFVEQVPRHSRTTPSAVASDDRPYGIPLTAFTTLVIEHEALRPARRTNAFHSAESAAACVSTFSDLTESPNALVRSNKPTHTLSHRMALSRAVTPTERPSATRPKDPAQIGRAH